MEYNNELKFIGEINGSRYLKIKEMLDSAIDRQREFCQTRSAFQLEKFLAEDEYTLASKYRHVSHNCFVALQSVENMILSREEIDRKIKNIESLEMEIGPEGLRESNKDIEYIKLKRARDGMEIQIVGMFKEIEIMNNICKSLEEKNGGAITYKQFEDEEPEYWKRRLANQMHTRLLSNKIGISEGDYSSYLKAVTKPIMETSNNMIEPYNIADFNHIATVALESKERVNKLFLQEKD